jgi:hypothetical protein
MGGVVIALLATLLLSGRSSASAPPSDPASIVGANYPADLAAELAADGEDVADNRQQAYARISSAKGDYIVAAYSNKARGAVVLLKNSSSGYTAVQEITDRIGEREPRVSAVDVDADGTPEAVVMFEYGQHPDLDTHVYRLADGQMHLISPTKDGASTIGFPHFLDISGTGVLDLENDQLDGSREKPVVVAEHYVLKDGLYVQAEPFDYLHTFYREEGQPVTSTSKIIIAAASVGKPFKMTIVNGGGSGADLRVSSATVAVNGVIVAGTGNFSQQSSSLTVPISLQQSNTLAVTLDGKRGARVTIVVHHD